MDFIQIANIIFENKSKYNTITDKEKEDNFYILNKKFSLGKLKVSQFFNNKHIDKASALDLWFLLLKKQKSTPGYWWSKNPFKKDKVKKVPKADKEMLMEYEQLTDEEYDFLYLHYKDDVEYKIKLLKRLE